MEIAFDIGLGPRGTPRRVHLPSINVDRVEGDGWSSHLCVKVVVAKQVASALVSERLTQQRVVRDGADLDRLCMRRWLK